MKKLLILVLLTYPCLCWGQKGNFLLEGAIGKYPVVMEIDATADGVSAAYYYRSTKKTIELDGDIKSGFFLLHTTKYDSKKNKDETTELFAIRPAADGNWGGTWTDRKGHKYDVRLAPVQIRSIVHPFAALPAVQQMRQNNLLAWLRSSQLRIKSDSTEQRGNYQLQYVHIEQPRLYTVRITGGMQTAAMKKANDVLMNSLIDHADQYYSCHSEEGKTDYDYTINGIYLSASVISIQGMLSYYCGGAHPDAGADNININAATGELLKLDDVLHFASAKQAEPIEDEIVTLLEKLYPRQMGTKSEEGCDYTDATGWMSPSWYFTSQGLVLQPDYGHVNAPCNGPEWAIIPYKTLNNYKNPAVKLTLP